MTDLTINTNQLDQEFFDNPRNRDVGFIRRRFDKMRAQLKYEKFGFHKVLMWLSTLNIVVAVIGLGVMGAGKKLFPSARTPDGSLMVLIRLVLGMTVSLLGLSLFIIGCLSMPLSAILGRLADEIAGSRARRKASKLA